jgi:hypothetical protein
VPASLFNRRLRGTHLRGTTGPPLLPMQDQKEHFMRMATRLVLAAAVFVTATAASANAQVTDRITFKTNFAFVAGNTTLPAGSYT